MVNKTNGKWWIRIDFTDLNQVYSKDSYPLSKNNQMVDATSGHDLLSFMDAFSSYNKIKMAPEDEEKTALITNRGLLCYRIISFGMKNVGATYQCLMNKAGFPVPVPVSAECRYGTARTISYRNVYQPFF